MRPNEDGTQGLAGWKGWELCSGRRSWADFAAPFQMVDPHFSEAGVRNTRTLPITPIECAVMNSRVMRGHVANRTKHTGGNAPEKTAQTQQD